MNDRKAIEAAWQVTTYEEAENLCKQIEESYDTISARQYYLVRSRALDSAYAAEKDKS